MATTLQEGKRTGEFLISEGNGTISREVVTIAASAGALDAGTILGMVTATKKCVAYNENANDGSNYPYGILLNSVPDLAVDQKAIAIVRFAEVDKNQLIGFNNAAAEPLESAYIFTR